MPVAKDNFTRVQPGEVTVPSAEGIVTSLAVQLFSATSDVTSQTRASGIDVHYNGIGFVWSLIGSKYSIRGEAQSCA